MDLNKKLKSIKLNSDKKILSNVYKVEKGGFGSDKLGIDTYLTSSYVEFLLDDVSTFETITKDKSWPVSQIIQREIDNRRIKDIASDYILRDRIVKYFPPILVAILPKNDNKLAQTYHQSERLTQSERIELYKKHGSEDETFKNFFLDSESLSIVDGLYILDLIPNINYKILAWDPTKYFAVVIDGQHRLESLKNSTYENKEVNKYLQDVVFIDLSRICSLENDLTPIKAVRTLFLDINNTSEPVSKARKCLMDDKDLASLFVQQILDDTEEKEHDYLKPQIVDWHSENLKHQLPHLTGVLVLYQLMSDTLLNNDNIVTIDDQRNEKKVFRWKNLINDRFSVDDQIKKINKYSDYTTVNSSYEKYKEEIIDDEDDDESNSFSTILFKYDYGVLKVATDYFNENYVNSIVYFFNSFTPYKKAMEVMTDHGAFDSNMKLNRLLIKNPNKVTKEEQHLLEDLKKDLIKNYNIYYYLLFSVLGQKTFFKFYFDKIIEGAKGNYINDVLLRESKYITNKLNTLLDITTSGNDSYIFGESNNLIIPIDLQKKYNIEKFGKQASSFWDGIIYDKNSIIYNARGTLSFSAVLDYIWKFMEKNKFGESDEIEELKYKDFNPSWVQNRIKRFLKRDFELEDHNELEKISRDILDCKAEFLNKLLIKKIGQWKV